nr:uncharacterized protein LOC122174288 [Chrysemys picta bellii]
MEAQVQTSHIEVLDAETLFPIESEPLEQTPDLDFQDMQVKNLFPLFAEVEVQTSNHELLKTLSSLSQKEAQVQTSQLSITGTEEMPLFPSQTEAQVQTSTLALTETEEEVTPFPVEEKPVPTTQSDAAVQTSYVDIPAGNKWRSSRLQAEAQVQTSRIELLKKLSSPLLTEAQVQTSKLAVMEAEEEEAPFPIEEKPLTKTIADAAVQTSYVDIPAGNKWRSSRLQTEAQVQTSSIELLKKLSSLLVNKAQVQTSSIELLKKLSSPSLTEAQVQTSKLAITETEEVPLSPSLTEAQVQTSKLAVTEAEEEEAPFPIEEKPLTKTIADAAAEMQTTRVEITEERQVPPTPPDVKILEEETLKEEVELKLPRPEYAEAQVQTSLVEIPVGKKWRSSRLCTEAQTNKNLDTSNTNICALTCKDDSTTPEWE